MQVENLIQPGAVAGDVARGPADQPRQGGREAGGEKLQPGARALQPSGGKEVEPGSLRLQPIPKARVRPCAAVFLVGLPSGIFFQRFKET